MIVDTQKIESLLNDTTNPSRGIVEDILSKALKLGGLDLSEAALLLKAEGQELDSLITEGAAKVKEKVFGSAHCTLCPALSH